MKQLYDILDVIQSSDYFGFTYKYEQRKFTYRFEFSNGTICNIKHDQLYTIKLDKDNGHLIICGKVILDYNIHKEEVDYFTRSIKLIIDDYLLYVFWTSTFPSDFKYNKIESSGMEYHENLTINHRLHLVWHTKQKKEIILDNPFFVTNGEFIYNRNFIKTDIGKKLQYDLGSNNMIVAREYDYYFLNIEVDGFIIPSEGNLPKENLERIYLHKNILEELDGNIFMYYNKICK